MKKLSEHQKIIQELAKLIKEKEKESSAEGRNAKDKEKERAHAEMTKRLEESEALGGQENFSSYGKPEGERAVSG